MKSRFFLVSIFALSSVLCALSQIPQGFNYQAVARSASGSPIVNATLQVRLTIQTDSLGGTVLWQELHSPVVTNDYGMFNLVAGKGARQASSTLAAFADIDWKVSPRFLKTEVFHNNEWKNMGSTRLWSVPYSMAAGDLAGSVKKLTVEGETADMEEALFEVKNRNGQTVFAVYNEGVRAWVGDGESKAKKGGFAIGSFDGSKGEQDLFIVTADSIRAYIYDDPLNKGIKRGGFAIGGFDPGKSITNDYLLVSPDSVRVYLDNNSTKGVKKGGFAIGSFDPSKGMEQEYLVVNRDSVRVYIDDDSTKAVKGGFAIGSFDPSKAGKSTFFDVSPNTSDIILSENRILWYPVKNAFLTGKVKIDHPDSVGMNSFASGYESKAKGQYSQALGYQSIARGDYSTAIGKNAVANEVNSFAFGENASARNEESYAFGRGAIAEGFRSYAFGSAGVDSAGKVTGVAYAKGEYSFAIGQGSQALGKGAFTLGLADTAKGDYSTAIGYLTRASGYGSTALGYSTTASGYGSTAIGFRITASHDYSTAMGYSTTASNWNSTAMGAETIASGWGSTAMGSETKASGNYSTTMGCNTTASNYNSTAMGFGTKASGWSSTAMGYTTTALGAVSTAMGYLTKANTYAMVAVGRYNDTTKYHGDYYTWYDDDPLFVIGKGSANNARSNAVTVLKNGRIGFQSVISPTYALELPNSSTVGVGQARAYAWTTYSDGRAKTERQPIPYGLPEVLQLNPQSYYHHSTESKEGKVEIMMEGVKDIGLIAQEVYGVIPEAVGRPASEESDLWSLSYDKLVPVLVKAIQEQQQQIESYESRLQSLQQEVDHIKAVLGSK